MRRFADFGTFKFERTAGCGCVLVRGHFSGDEEKFALEEKGFAWELIWGGGRLGLLQVAAAVDHSVFEINLSLFGVLEFKCLNTNWIFHVVQNIPSFTNFCLIPKVCMYDI